MCCQEGPMLSSAVTQEAKVRSTVQKLLHQTSSFRKSQSSGESRNSEEFCLNIGLFTCRYACLCKIDILICMSMHMPILYTCPWFMKQATTAASSSCSTSTSSTATSNCALVDLSVNGFHKLLYLSYFPSSYPGRSRGLLQ